MKSFSYELSDDDGVFKKGKLFANSKDDAILNIAKIVRGDYVITKLEEEEADEMQTR